MLFVHSIFLKNYNINMKKTIAVLLFLPLLSFAQNGFTINGTLTNLKDSTLVFLQDITGVTVAQDYAQKTKFTLKGNADPGSLYVVNFIGANKTSIELFIANENITLTGNFLNAKDVVVTGSATHMAYKKFMNGFVPSNTKITALVKTINQEKNTKKRDSLIGVFQKEKAKMFMYVDGFIKGNTTSVVSSFVLMQFSNLYQEIGGLESTYATLQGNATKGMFANEVSKMITKSKIGSVGSVAEEFVQNDTANVPVSLSSFKGKYVLVDFWASWCRPCRLENPNVVAAFNKFKDKNFTVLGVSLDQTKESWIKAIEADKLTWTHVSDLQYWNNAVARQYGIQGIPANILIDPTGKIIAKNIREEELHSKLNELLK
jgi:peroxiredoxin